MPRRFLRKINHKLDFERYLLIGRDLTETWRPSEAFSTDRPLEVEIGSGKGLFMKNESVRNPNHNFLGIEIAHNYAAYCALQLAKANEEQGVDNALMVSGDAVPLFTTNIPDGSLEAVHIYFPDPWWKKKHRKRRIINPVIVHNIYRTLRIGGKFHFWTDVEEYYQSALNVMRELSPLEGPFPVDETPATDTDDYRTHFEKRTRENGLPVFRCYFQKTDRTEALGTADSEPIPESQKVETVVIPFARTPNPAVQD